VEDLVTRRGSVSCSTETLFQWVNVKVKVNGKRHSSPVTDLEWPRRFQEVKVPRFLDNGTGWW
jgi:hypothetical protein